MATHPEDFVTGKTIRLSWTEGPTAGKSHDHVFHENGTVEWGGPKEKPKFKAFMIGDDVCLFSYLSSSGYTLTVALNLEEGTVNGFASNDKTWAPVGGTFEVLS